MFQTLSSTYVHKKRLTLGPTVLTELAADKVKEEQANVAVVCFFLFLYFAVSLIVNSAGAVVYSSLKTTESWELFCVTLALDVFGLFTASMGFYSVGHVESEHIERFVNITKLFCISYVLSWAFEIAIYFSKISESMSEVLGLSNEQGMCLVAIFFLIVSLLAAFVYKVAENFYLAYQDWRAYTPNNDGTYKPPILLLDR